MAVNKNFVVKHGLEVNSDLILADSTNKRVGIGTTIPDYTLEVIGGIGVTDINATGIATVKKTLQVGSSGTVISAFESGLVGIGTTNPAYLLDVRTSTGATTGTTVLYVQGDATVTGNLDVAGDIQYDEVTGRNLYISGLSTFVGASTFESAVGFRTDVFVSGMSTIVGVATFRDDVFVDGNLNVSGDISYDQVTGREIYISGLSTFVGLSSFVNGVYIGGITTTAGSGGITTTGGNLSVGTDLLVAGVSTFVGVSTFQSTLFTKDLYVTGVSTFGGALAGEDALYISSNVGVGTTNAAIAADSNNTKILNTGIVTANYLYGDGSGITNITAVTGGTIGIQSGTTYIGSGLTTLGVTGGSATVTPVSSGIATITLPAAGVSLGLAIALGG